MTVLPLAEDALWWVETGAMAILSLHILAGTVALLSGAAALAVRKGSRLHRRTGNLFVVSMVVMAAIGAAVSPFLLTAGGERKWFDAAAGMLALYLVVTAWLTVWRKAGTVAGYETAAAAGAVGTAALTALFGMHAAQSASGTYGGYGASDYYVFAGVFALAAAADLRMILRGGSSGVGRIMRHLWRMCAALFIAAGAFFFGQQRVMPEFMQGSPLLAVPPFATLGLMVFWLLRVRLAKRLNALARTRRRRAGPGTAETAG